MYCSWIGGLASLNGGKEPSMVSKVKSEEQSNEPKKRGRPKSDKSTAPSYASTTKAPEIPEFKVDIREIKSGLPNTIWFIPTDKQIVSVCVVFKDAGTKNFSKTHPSLDRFVPDMLLKGAGKFNYPEFLEAMSDNGASIDFSIDMDHANASVWVPFQFFKEAFNLMVLTLTKPKLPNKYLKMMKKDALVNFEESLKVPHTLLAEAFNKLFYPDNHPYRVSLDQVKNDITQISTSDIRDYLGYLSQSNAYVVVLGPKEKQEEIVAHITAALNALPLHGKTTITGTFAVNTDAKDTHVDSDVPQSVILARTLGFNKTDPEYFAKRLALAVVAQPSLNSMMFRRIREELGLAYSCYGRLYDAPLDQCLKFFIGTQSATASTARAELKGLLEQVGTKGISQADFHTTKQEMLGSTIVGLDSSSKIVSFVASKRVDGYSAPEVTHYTSKYASVSYEQANAAAKSMFSKLKLVFVSVGRSGGNYAVS